MIMWTTYPAEKTGSLQAIRSDISSTKETGDTKQVDANILRLEPPRENAKILRGRRSPFPEYAYGEP